VAWKARTSACQAPTVRASPVSSATSTPSTQRWHSKAVGVVEEAQQRPWQPPMQRKPAPHNGEPAPRAAREPSCEPDREHDDIPAHAPPEQSPAPEVDPCWPFYPGVGPWPTCECEPEGGPEKASAREPVRERKRGRDYEPTCDSYKEPDGPLREKAVELPPGEVASVLPVEVHRQQLKPAPGRLRVPPSPWYQAAWRWRKGSERGRDEPLQQVALDRCPPAWAKAISSVGSRAGLA
jgi:hypothetical protein